MNFWGKIVGGISGFAVGGPLGGVVGALLGHAADEKAIPSPLGLQRSWSAITGSRARVAAMFGRRDQVFTFAVVALAAKLCKCDGPIKRVEIDAFKRHFHINPESVKTVGRLFDKARDSRESVEDMAAPLGEAFINNRALLEEVMVALYSIALADGPVNAAERDFLGRVHRALGLDHLSWNRVHHGQEQASEERTHQERRQQQRPEQEEVRPRRPAEPTPYQILGVSPRASDDEIRTVWRNLMRENHPDSLSARHVPKEFIARASDKVARINAAWDSIKRERGL